jgi:hypothetical protein
LLRGFNGLPVSEASATNIDDLGLNEAIGSCASSAKATSQQRSRSSLEPAAPSDFAVGERREGVIVHGRVGQRLERRTAH